MTRTLVVNLKRGERCDVYMGRASSAGRARLLLLGPREVDGLDGCFGNPFPVMNGGRGSSLAFFVPWFHRRVMTDPDYLRRVLSLRGLRLGCFCVPLPCHASIIAEWVDAFPEEWAWALLAAVEREAATPRSRSA